MIGILLSLPTVMLVVSYAWAVIKAQGLIQGFHITALAISFFILTSPILAYLYVFGLVPGQNKSENRNLEIFFVWIGSLILNIITIKYFPKLYKCSPITKVALETLTTPFTRNSTIAISGCALLYHWLVSKIQNRFLKIWFHTIGIIISGLIFYKIIPAIRDVLIIVFNAGNENF